MDNQTTGALPSVVNTPQQPIPQPSTPPVEPSPAQDAADQPEWMQIPQPAQPAVPAAPVSPAPQPQPMMGSSFHKEAAPVPTQGVDSGELVHPTEAAPRVPETVEQAGIEVPKNPEVPDLTVQDKNAGVSHAPGIAPVITEPTHTIQLPVTEEKAWETVKTADSQSSGWARALQITKIFKKIHKKIIGG